MQPYTEAANSITIDIDISSPAKIVEKLKKCDEEMFHPRNLDKSVKTLQSDDIVEAVCGVAKLAKDLLEDKSPDSMIVMSGCGTSGRIAFMMARTYNRIASSKKFAYTIAGGDKALFTSQEAPEDDHVIGRNDLIKTCEGMKRVLYIGITCGLSAPYVAGQLDHCMNNPDVFTPVLLGFNPISLSRNVPISAWNKTFLDVAQHMEELAKESKAFVINPVVLGEAISGSSRMKGGTMTKIILDIIYMLATSSVTSFTPSQCKSMLSSYQSVCKSFYKENPAKLSSLLSSAGDSFKSEGHLYYVASGETGVLGIIDATECTPTYGSDLNDVRGFIKGGYSEYDNNEGNISSLGENYEISVTDLATLLSSSDKDSRKHSNDTIIVMVTSPQDTILEDLNENESLGSALRKVCASESGKVFLICLLEKGMENPILPSYFTDVTTLRVVPDDVIPDVITTVLSPLGKQRMVSSLMECCAKWLYNCVSTGGHVLRGKVMKNYMVDLKVSNQKLFHRSIGIIQRFCPGLSDTEAKKYLLCSIYELDDVDMTLLQSPASSHILIATPKDKVVPTAIVMAHKKCRFLEAQQMLQEYHVIREAIAKLTNQQ